MQMRSVSWPAQGDIATFRRRASQLMMACASMLVAAVATLAIVNRSLLLPTTPLLAGVAALAALWIHGAARRTARRREVEQSFAGLGVLHAGERFHVARHRPMLGEFGTRRDATDAALQRGGWALIVRAWDRYYLLAASPAAPSAAPVSFRSRAVADVVPAIRDDVA